MAAGEATSARSSVFRYLVLAAVLLAGLVAGLFLADKRATPAFTHATDDPYGRIRTIRVDPATDRDKAGSVHGVMGWRFFEVPAGTSGLCPDELRFEFSAPAEIRQIDVSIDINDPRLTLVEFAAAINSTRASASTGAPTG
jgi:hypothetical protein